MKLSIRRFIAFCIDFSLISCICYLFLEIFYPLVLENVILELMLGISLCLLFFTLLLRKDCIFGYESIGKKLMHLKIYNQSNERVMDKKILQKRIYYNLLCFPHVNGIMILAGCQSDGDQKMHTVVR